MSFSEAVSPDGGLRLDSPALGRAAERIHEQKEAGLWWTVACTGTVNVKMLLHNQITTSADTYKATIQPWITSPSLYPSTYQ